MFQILSWQFQTISRGFLENSHTSIDKLGLACLVFGVTESRVTNLIAVFAAAALATVGGQCLAATRQDVVPGMVFDESGRPLASPFEGLRASTGASAHGSRLLAPQACRLRSGAPGEVISGASKRYAPRRLDSCTPGGCYGSYFVATYRECPPACFGFWEWHYSDSNEAGPSDGWEYSGMETCFWCGICQERSCQSQGPG